MFACQRICRASSPEAVLTCLISIVYGRDTVGKVCLNLLRGLNKTPHCLLICLVFSVDLKYLQLTYTKLCAILSVDCNFRCFKRDVASV